MQIKAMSDFHDFKASIYKSVIETHKNINNYVILLSAYDDLSAFKIYLMDVGLLRRLAQLAPTAFGEGNRLFTEFKDALTENYVLQTLITQFEIMPRYWSQNNPPYQVDFLIQRENEIFPIDV